MIRWDRVSAGGFRSLSFEVKAGDRCKIITDSDHGLRLMVNLLVGLKAPARGRAYLLDSELSVLSEQEHLAVLERVGVVWSSGGFISNLKVWENIILPQWHLHGREPAELEPEVVDLLHRLGMDQGKLPRYLASQPGTLPPYERRMIGMVRAMLMEPDLIIYDSVFTGLRKEAAARFAELAKWFHLQREGRSTVYLSSSEEQLGLLEAEQTVYFERSGATV